MNAFGLLGGIGVSWRLRDIQIQEQFAEHQRKLEAMRAQMAYQQQMGRMFRAPQSKTVDVQFQVIRREPEPYSTWCNLTGSWS